jgi:hypothetical protein
MMNEVKMDQIKMLAQICKDYGLTSLKAEGWEITRDPGIDAVKAMQDAAEKMTTSATDEEILMNPSAGLGAFNV